MTFTPDSLTRHLRYRVAGLLHASLVRTGDRLPSIREMARRLDVDHRAVAAAYRRLEEEGLVEIRRGSGVYVSADESAGRGIEHATASWIADVFTQGWLRRTPRLDVGELIHRSASHRIRCACIESVADHMVALSAELERDFDVIVDPLYVDDDGHVDATGIEKADLLVCLQFHASLAERVAADAGIPCIVVGINPELSRALDRILATGPVVAVVADAAMIERARSYFAVTDHAGRIEPVLAGSLKTLDEAARPGYALLATRAARRLLGAEAYHLLPEPTTFISVDSARNLFTAITRIALRQDRG